MNDGYVAPDLGRDAFNCPYCNAFAHQSWWSPYVVANSFLQQYYEDGGFEPFDSDRQMYIISGPKNSPGVSLSVENMFISSCSRCQNTAIWFCHKMVYPISSPIPLPHHDLPDHIKKHYNEARDIFDLSVRGAMALLRLCLQELCKHLKLSGDINKAIEELVKNNRIPVEVKQSLDIIRVTGNHAVHPGLIDFNDNKEAASALFDLINEITDSIISKPQKIDDIYKKLPKEDLKGIEKRDKKASRKNPTE